MLRIVGRGTPRHPRSKIGIRNGSGTLQVDPLDRCQLPLADDLHGLFAVTRVGRGNNLEGPDHTNGRGQIAVAALDERLIESVLAGLIQQPER